MILATNLSKNIDDAFTRRIHGVIEFPFPDAEARAKIWRGLFPPDLERPPDAAIERLAERFALAGGHVRNIVLDAAYRAVNDAAGGTPKITLANLAQALARQHEKLGLPVTRSAFGVEFYAQLGRAGEIGESS